MRHITKLTCCVALLAAACLARAEALRAALLDVAPYAMRSADGGVVGLYPDLLRGIVIDAGMTLDLSLVPFARVAQSLRDRSSDITLGFSTEALQVDGMSLGVVASYESLVVANPERRELHKREALAAWTVGRLRGGCQDLEKLDIGIKFVELSSFTSGLRMLKMRRLDAVCGITREALQLSLGEAGVRRDELGATLVTGRRDVHLFVRRDLAQETRERLQRSMKRYQQSQPQRG